VQAKTNHISLLDGYRFLAALMVVSYHYWSKALDNSRYSLEYGNIFRFPELSQVTSYGSMGVDLFFMISGFVIALSAEGSTFSKFMASRIARILPTYWLALILTTAFLLWEGEVYRIVTLRQFLVNLIFLQRPMGEEFIDGVYWTIVIEMRFYLLVAALIALGLYRFYAWILFAWILLCLVDFMGAAIGVLRQAFITSYGFYFAAGGSFYFIYRKKYIRLSVMTIILSLVIALPNIIKRFGDNSAEISTVILLAIYGLMFVITTKRFVNIQWNWLPVAGAMTYPFYLIHEVIGFILMRHMNFIKNGFIITIVVLMLMLMLMLMLSWIIHRCFERWAVPLLRQQLLHVFFITLERIQIKKLFALK